MRVLAVVVVAALTLAGLAIVRCSLPGLDDRTASYVLPAAAPLDLAARVEATLRTARFTAEVQRRGPLLQVRTPARELDAVCALLAEPPGLLVRHRATPCGADCVDREIDAAEAEAARDDATPRVFAPSGRGRVRAIAIRGERPEQVLRLTVPDLRVVRGAGATLVASLAPGSPAEARFASETEDIVLTDGTRALYMGPARGPWTLRFGDDLASYERARLEHARLTAPPLPRLVAPKLETPPRDLGLAALTLALPALMSLVYLGFVRRFDRAHPEPLGLVAVTFVLGALSTLPAMALEAAAWRLSPWLDPHLLGFGGQARALPLATLGFALTVGVPEEGAKLVATLYASRRREFDEPVDGVVYGVASALGFAAAENVLYFAFGRLSPLVVVGRTFTALPVHLFLAGLWGYALGARLVRPGQPLLRWFALAALSHGLYDALLNTTTLAALAGAVVLGLALAFVLVLRAALRYGPVSVASLRAAAGARATFSLGRNWAFVGLATLLPALALAFVGATAAWQGEGGGLRSPQLLPMAALGVAIAATLWGITASIPLDAVVDAHGVTFAGAVRSHTEIDAMVRRGAYLELHCASGDIELGPGPEDTLAALEHAIRAHRPREPDGSTTDATIQA